MRRLLAVLGADVSRSLSPLLHGAAARALGLDLAYVPVSCRDPAHFEAAVRALSTLGALGANVTIPYKLDALRLSERLTDTARAIGAVNTLVFSGPHDGELLGDNTDGPGLVRLLVALPAGALDRVVVLGAGGSARAAAWAAREAGAGELRVRARRLEEAEAAAAVGEGRGELLEGREPATCVISTLPGAPDLAARAMAEWIEPGARPALVDLAYGTRDAESPLVALARAAGLSATDGRALLVEQAALALERWTGVEAERARLPMLEALGLPAPPPR